MARLNAAQMIAAAIENLGAAIDPTEEADLVFDRGQMVVAADSAAMKPSFQRLKKIDGYRWILINAQDLMGANALSIGSKAGIITCEGKVLKAADLPRQAL